MAIKTRLTNKQIADGINTATANAVRLAADSESMFNLNRYPTSLALAILSIEESGKPAVLRKLSVAIDEAHVISAWKDFRDHRKKNIMSSFEEMFNSGARNINDFSPMFLSTNKAPALLDKLKQDAIYCNYINNKWHLPENAIDKNKAQYYLTMAISLLPKNSNVTEKEIELYVRHLKQEKNINNLEETKRSVIEFYKDMLCHDLLDEIPDYIYELYGRKNHHKLISRKTIEY